MSYNTSGYFCVPKHLKRFALTTFLDDRVTLQTLLIQVLYCVVLYCIVLYCIVLYCTVLYHSVLHSRHFLTTGSHCRPFMHRLGVLEQSASWISPETWNVWTVLYQPWNMRCLNSPRLVSTLKHEMFEQSCINPETWDVWTVRVLYQPWNMKCLLHAVISSLNSPRPVSALKHHMHWYCKNLMFALCCKKVVTYLSDDISCNSVRSFLTLSLPKSQLCDS
jgi:hypothetical protein